MNRTILTLAITTLSFSLFTGCEKAEIKDLASAQKCLDAVPSSTPTAAEACFAYVAGYNTQQANILKCSIKLTSGGLNTAKIVEAADVSDNDSITNKEAAYVGFLALTSPDRVTGYATAQEAYQYCVQSELTDLEFVGGLAKIASMLAVAAGDDFDISNPSAAAAAIGQAFEDCVDGSITCDMNDVGTTVAALSQSYCDNASADEDVCKDINTAIDAAGGDATTAAKHFMCQLQDKTFNGTACAP